MHLWVLLPSEPITDDRAYLIGFLKCVFNLVTVTYVDRQATEIPDPEARPDLVLNLLSTKRREALEAIDAKARQFGASVSPPSESAWRSEDKRTYLVDYPDVCPPTKIARSMAELAKVRSEFGGEIVVKDPLGHAGKGVERIRSSEDLHLAERMFSSNIGNSRELIVQPYLSGFSKGDKRVLAQRLPDGTFKIIAYYLRRPPPGGWKSNIRNGGQVVRSELTQPEAELALFVAPRANLDNASIDIGEHDGKIYLIETNLNYGGIIDFDLDKGTCNVRECAEFLLHLARYGRAHSYDEPNRLGISA